MRRRRGAVRRATADGHLRRRTDACAPAVLSPLHVTEAGADSWSNWSGSVQCRPRRVEHPADEAAVAALVRRAADEGLPVRVAGTGHSFMPLVESDGVVVKIEALRGLESHDPTALQAWVRAGSVLHDLGDPLRDVGMAMQNMGDIDVQTLGGALGTGTHGTGPTLGNLSSRVVGVRYVDARGEIVECTQESDPETLRALRVAVGSAGDPDRGEAPADPALPPARTHPAGADRRLHGGPRRRDRGAPPTSNSSGSRRGTWSR